MKVSRKNTKLSGRERLLSAARGEEVDCTPVWFMRQAGRYLPQYREIRKRYSILEICKMPDLCKNVTLMPVKELGVDAAVMFADIMLPLEGIGIKFQIEDNLGPVISNPVTKISSAEQLKTFDAKRDVPFVLQAIKKTREQMDKESKAAALVGFSGAPFTLASYIIEGQATRDFTKTKNLMYNDGDTWRVLMTKLSKMVSDYLSAQIESGVDAVQIFDSWVGSLSIQDYTKFVSPYTERISDTLRKDYPDTPRIHFGTNTLHLLKPMSRGIKKGDVFSIDWRIPINTAKKILGSKTPIQGNLEPAVLLSNDKRGFIAERTQEVIEEAKSLAGHIFNLGHGMLRDTPVENAKFVVDYVHAHT